MKKNKTIVYNGNYDDLYKLQAIYGEVDSNKLLDWLTKSKNIFLDDDTRKTLNKQIRKNKIDKINKKLD